MTSCGNGGASSCCLRFAPTNIGVADRAKGVGGRGKHQLLKGSGDSVPVVSSSVEESGDDVLLSERAGDKLSLGSSSTCWSKLTLLSTSCWYFSSKYCRPYSEWFVRGVISRTSRGVSPSHNVLTLRATGVPEAAGASGASSGMASGEEPAMVNSSPSECELPELRASSSAVYTMENGGVAQGIWPLSAQVCGVGVDWPFSAQV